MTTVLPSSSHLGKRFRSSDFKAGSLGWKNVNENDMCQIWDARSTFFSNIKSTSPVFFNDLYAV